jgi:hypothetical protein
MKIKTFSFEDNSIFKYNGEYERKNLVWNTNGEYYYTKNIELIDKTINDFINNDKINIIDVKINSIVKGNNPPTSILIYTIIYKENKRNEE